MPPMPVTAAAGTAPAVGSIRGKAATRRAPVTSRRRGLCGSRSSVGFHRLPDVHNLQRRASPRALLHSLWPRSSGETAGMTTAALACSGPGVRLRRLPLPARRHRRRGSLVLALRPVLSGRRRTPGRARHPGRPRHHLPLGPPVHAAADRRRPAVAAPGGRSLGRSTRPT